MPTFFVKSLMNTKCLIALVTMLGVVFTSPVDAQESPAKKAADKLYELRIYTANPGKLPDLHARFRDHTLKLFEKHGMENIIYWNVSEGTNAEKTSNEAENMLVYIIAHKNKEAADASWAAFQADPVWQAARAKSEENGKILAKAPVAIFMKPTDFSAADEPVNKDGSQPARLFELRQYNDGAAGVPGTVDRFKSGEKEIFPKHGMTTVSFWTSDDAFIYLLAHKDREASRASWAAFGPDFRKFQTEYNAKRAAAGETGQAGGASGSGRRPSETRFLTPTDYSPRK